MQASAYRSSRGSARSTLQLLAARISRSPGIGSVAALLRARVRRHEPMRSAEVQDAELTLASYENVSRLEVAMNNPALVSVCQSCAELLDQLPSLRLLHRRGTQAFQYLGERLALEHLHREKDHVSVAIQLVNIHYVSMR